MARAEQKERTRAGILDSAARLVRERGIVAASVSEVMKGAGLTVGGFYAHFESKEALVEETIRRTMREARQKLFGHIREEGLARLDAVLRTYLSKQHRDEPAVCPLPSIAGELAAAGAHEEVLAEELGISVDKLIEMLPAGRERRANAIAILALMFGGLTLSRAVRGTKLSDEILHACRAFARNAFPKEHA